jgi:hypothetical protein
MAWTKHWKVVTDGSRSPISGQEAPVSYLGAQADAAFRNYQSMLPDVYSGHPNRVDRYNQYENMDLDSEINAALDILAEFCTQHNKDTGTSFVFKFNDDATDNEIEILREQLKAWNSLNEFDQRIFKIVRNTFKYGDQIFVRDPENYKWFWVEMNKVSKVVVNESSGKVPEIYFIRDLNPNLQNSTITSPPGPNDSYAFSPSMGGSRPYNAAGAGVSSPGTRFGGGLNEMPVSAEHVVHFSMTEGLDINWPFGVSILEAVFKTFKQKELLEDALLIYRVQRAPERRIFYIDVGTMPPHLAMQFVERIKNEIHQRRIPTQSGGGSSLMDASYNPLSINEDYFFPQTAEGRGSKVETLPGGQNLGEIDDLKYFTNKLFRGLRIPSSYLPTGTEEGGQMFNDGRMGTALIQEFRFNQYCQRLQKNLAHKFDQEFKLFLKFRGYNIDNSLFDLQMNEPQNFASYRDVELNSQRITAFNAISPTDILAKRFTLKKYLGLSELEMEENERLWREERSQVSVNQATGTDLRNVGITPGAISSDLDTLSMPDEFAPYSGTGEPPGETPTVDGAAAPAAPGAPAAGTAGGLAGPASGTPV